MSCSNSNESNEINKDNIVSKIDQAFFEAEVYDNDKALISVLFFIENNKVNIKDSCVLSKISHLKALKSNALNEHIKLLKYVNRGILIAENCDDNVVKIALNNLLGIFYFRNKNFPFAIKYYNKAIFYGEKSANKSFLIDTYFNLSSLYANLNDWDEVIINAQKGIAAIEKSNSKESRLKYFYTFLAKAYTNLNKHKLSEINLINATKIAEKLKEKTNDKQDYIKAYREIYLTYAELSKNQKEYDLAYKFMKASDSLLELKSKIQQDRNKIIFDTEKALEKELFESKEKLIFNYTIITVGSILFLLIGIFFIYKNYKFSKRLRNVLNEKEELNAKLKYNFKELKETHKSLVSKNEEINSLLKFNKQTLFTKTLKISNYKDAVNNVIKHINKLTENNASIKSAKMHSITRSLQQIISEEDVWVDFKLQFEKNKPNFFKRLLEKSPNLSINELKHCAFVAVNLKSKEVANIINLSPRSVETTRYRIKKKLKLKDQTLQEFLDDL